MWSRLVQVAQDVAQDLAQPQDDEDDDASYDDEGEYYEEGEGWQEEEHYDDDNNAQPSWDEQQCVDQYAYDEEGEAQYDDAGGEEQFGEGEHLAYDGSEDYQQQNDFQDAGQVEEVHGWAEEEVDFSAENYGEDQQGGQDAIEEQSLFEHNNTASVADDEWDLEDEDLFDTAEAEQPSPTHQTGSEALQQALENHANILHESADADPENEWGNDENLNFDDGDAAFAEGENTGEELPQVDVEGEGLEVPGLVDDVVGNAHDNRPEIEDTQDTNEWDQEDSLNFDDSHIQEDASLPRVDEDLNNTTAEAVEQQEEQQQQPANEETLDLGVEDVVGDEWGDNFDLDNAYQDEADNAIPADAVGESQDDENNVGNDWGEDDLSFDDSKHVDDEVKTTAESLAEIDTHDAPAVLVAGTTADITSEAIENTVGNEWDDDNLNFDDSQVADNVGEIESPAVRAGKEVHADNVISLEQESNVSDGAFDVAPNEWGDDDLNLEDSHHYEEDLRKSETSAELAVEDVHVNNNVSLEQENIGSNAAEDVSPNEWGDDDLNFDDSHHVAEDAEVQAEPVVEETLIIDSQSERQHAVSGAADNVVANNEWDDDDLNLDDSHHVAEDTEKNEEVAKQEDDGITEEIIQHPEHLRDPAATGWGDDGLKFDSPNGAREEGAVISQLQDATVETTMLSQQYDSTDEGTANAFSNATDTTENEWSNDDLDFVAETADAGLPTPGEANHSHPDKNDGEINNVFEDRQAASDENPVTDQVSALNQVEAGEVPPADLDDQNPDGYVGDVCESDVQNHDTDDIDRASDCQIAEEATKSATPTFDGDARDEVAEQSADGNGWDDSGLDFDDSKVEQSDAAHVEEECDDDSTVEQSNIGIDQFGDGHKSDSHSIENITGSEVQFVHGLNQSRRSTVRVSNTSSLTRMESGDGLENVAEDVAETSLMFKELAVIADVSPKASHDEESKSRDMPSQVSSTESGPSIEAQLSNAGMGISQAIGEMTNTEDVRDNLSSVSDNTDDMRKPSFETQISMMTLKSLADSCPSRQRGNESDDDDEGEYGPVVDKTPELSTEPRPIPELSTMTINSTAVAAHSIGEDIQRDEDMDGTYYGGSVAGENQSNDNAWEEDDAISLGSMHHDLSEKIVDFELATDPAHASPGEKEEAQASAPDPSGIARSKFDPPLDSSMANVYDEDNSVPSRDEDDDDENVYKPVVDQVPKTHQTSVTNKSGRTMMNSMSVLADNPEADGAQTCSSTARARGDDDNAWDDGGSLGDLDLDEGEAERSGQAQNSSQIVVENAPKEDSSTGGKSGGSVAAVESVENSCPSRVHDSDEEVYGLVVDQIPDSPPPLIDQMSVAASSMAVVANNVEQDLKEDEDLDATEHGGSATDELGTSCWDEDQSAAGDKPNGSSHVDTNDAVDGDRVAQQSDLEDIRKGDRVVDLTPKVEPNKKFCSSSNSLAVLAHSVTQDFNDEDEDEEDDANFGPIVDITPAPRGTPAITPSSTAVQAANIREDIKLDEATDEGIGDVNWDEECPELEGLELGEDDKDGVASGTPAKSDDMPGGNRGLSNQVNLVDHTPEGETPGKLKGDASLAVLAPSEDGTCLSINDADDGDTIDPTGERVSYGPVVDSLPTFSAGPTSAAPSVTFSLAVEARSVDEDFKLDDEMDETFCGDTTIEGVVGENGWGDDQTLDDLDIDRSSTVKFKPQFQSPKEKVVVDHTPEGDSPSRIQGDASLVALAPSVGSTLRADDSANDDDTITHDEDLYGKVVDHTPRLDAIPFVTSTSMAVGASSADYRSEMEREEEMDATCENGSVDVFESGDAWGDDEKALDAIDAEQTLSADKAVDEHLVDHTPAAEDQQKPNVMDPSIAVLAPSDDGSRSADDNDTCNANHAFGPVVDITPPQPPESTGFPGTVAAVHDGELEGTLFGDSTIGGDGGWDDDDVALEDIVLEEKETEFATGVAPISNQWQASSDNASSHMENSTLGKSFADASASQDGVVLVDHTPSEIDSSARKTSVAWLLNVESGMSGDETEDASSSWRPNEAAGQRAQAEEDQVVDRIPLGSGSRYGDASTLVVADPSEIISHVGDLLQGESDFGPVVDVTPPSRPMGFNAASAAGSTMVVAPTGVADDLDADPDDTINAGEENGWEDDPPELNQAPNPQSDDTPRVVDEQVVDFLPPQEDNANQDENRDGWSELATGGAPSVLAADPKEEEFGPVVDQLPAQHPSTLFSAVSTASQVAPSECQALEREDETEDDSKQDRNAIVVDPLPRPFEVGLQNLDSTASLAHSLASEDEDDDDGKYGPVVDHLPSIRSSLPPSRGGSTVDALATVSEVIDDDDDDDDEEGGDGSLTEGGGSHGWGDDDLAEIDLHETNHVERASTTDVSAVVEPKASTDDQSSTQERGMTVRFRSVVAAIFESKADAEPVGDELENIPSTEADDAAQAEESNAWDDDVDFDASFNVDLSADGGQDHSALLSSDKYTQFAEADTPPATPYKRSHPAQYDPNGLPTPVSLPDLVTSPLVNTEQCITCANATTIDCPCVQRILKQHDEGNEDIRIDFTKLLQTEITKRRLIEEESKDLRTQLQTLQTSRTAGEVHMDTVKTLQEHVRIVEGRLESAENECSALRRSNEDLLSSADEAQRTLIDWEERQKHWLTKESALREDVENARQRLEASLSEAEEKQRRKEQELVADSEQKKQSMDKLSQELNSLQSELSALRDENARQSSDLESFRKSLVDRDGKIQEFLAKEATHEVELKTMRDKFREMEEATVANDELQELHERLQIDLSSKEADCAEMATQITDLQHRVQQAESERFKLLRDQEHMKKLHSEEVSQGSTELRAARMELEEARNVLIREGNDANLRQQKLEVQIQEISAERDLLQKKLYDAESRNKSDLEKMQAAVSQKETDLAMQSSSLQSERQKTADLSKELDRLNSVAQKVAALEEQLKSAASERDTMLVSLNESNDEVLRLQLLIDDHNLEEGELENRKNEEIESLVAERASLRNTVASKSAEVEARVKDLEELTNEKDLLEKEVADLTATCKRLAAAEESSRLVAASEESARSNLREELEAVKEKLALLENASEAAKAERGQILARNDELELALSKATSVAEINASKVNELEKLLSATQQEANALRDSNVAITQERDDAIGRCEKLEKLLSGASDASNEASRLMEENISLNNKANAVKREFEEQRIVLQNFEVRVAALEQDLASEKESNTLLKDSISHLRSELDLAKSNAAGSVDDASDLPSKIAELEVTITKLQRERNELERLLASQSSGGPMSARKDVLSEENEELLVHFGLIDEEIESYQEQIKELKSLVERYERTSGVAETRIMELQQRLASAEAAHSQNGVHHGSDESIELESLRNDQARLAQEIEQLSSLMADKDTALLEVTEELASVKLELEATEKSMSERLKSLEQENQQWRSTVAGLEAQQDESLATFTRQNAEISSLQNELDEVRSAKSAFETRASVLEEACLDRDQSLAHKEQEVRDLVQRLQEASGGSSEATQEILHLRETINEKEFAERLSVERIRELSASYETSQNELDSTRREITSLQACVDQLEQDLISKGETSEMEEAEHKSQLVSMENTLQSKSKEAAELTTQNALLLQEIAGLRADLEAAQGNLQLQESEAEQIASEEVESLRNEVKALLDDIEKAKLEGTEREELLTAQLNETKRSVASKDGEVMMLKKKMQSLNKELGEYRHQVEAKQGEVEQISTELEEIRNRQEKMEKAGGKRALDILQQTKENASDVESLRLTVISLASALETSECRRADAIERILKERETYADSLRRLSESVKRFYNSLSFNEA